MLRLALTISAILRPDDDVFPPREKDRIQLYRLLSILGAFLIPCFSIVYRLSSLEATSPAWAYVGLSGLFAGLFAASFISKQIRRRYVSLMWGVMYLQMIWITAVVAANRFAGEYVLALLLVYASIGVVIELGARSLPPILWFLGFGFVTTAGGLFFTPAPQSAPSIVLGIMAVAGLTIGFSLRGRLLVREQRDLLDRLIETSPNAIVRLDESGTFVQVSGRASDVLGVSEEALLGRPYDDLEWDFLTLGGDNLSEGTMPFARVLSTGQPIQDVEFGIRWPDGAQRFLSVSGAPLYGKGGRTREAVFHLRDITDRERRERILRERQEEIEALYETADRLLRVSDEEEVGTVLAELIQDTFDYRGVSVRLAREGELVVTHVAETTFSFMPDRPDFRVDGDSAVARAYRAGETLAINDLQETAVEDPNEYGDLRSVLVVPMGAHGTLAVGSPTPHAIGPFDRHMIEVLGSYGTAVLDRLKQEEALRGAKEEAEEASRLKSSMLANMSHEIRTPLTSIIGFAEAVAEEASDQEGTIPRFTELIEQSGKRLLETLEGVLNLSKLEAGQMDLEARPVDLGDHTQRTTEELRPKADEKGLDFRVEVSAPTPYAEADAGGIQIVLQNLVSNAIKYTEEGGIVWVRSYRETDEAVLEVEDTGIGMDPSMVETIFKPFRQVSEGTSRKYEGTGVGLAVTKKAVEEMNGALAVDTEEGEGSRFTVRLPMPENKTKEAPKTNVNQRKDRTER